MPGRGGWSRRSGDDGQIVSGQEQWANRGNWALSYLNRAGAVERPSRGRYRIAGQLLTRIRAQEPVFFEQAVLDLLIAMGYGGVEGSATRTQLAGVGGIDGIIDQDALGVSRVYFQAKRYASDNVVGRPAIQEFVGTSGGSM